ncbi:hypothetical protein [Hymenobacter sp. DG01]|uniref:hypothetical protein n=1 Tax=Hymenobacter sp. DG01 TaxID=2584940 RepID=UPI0011246E93|nr:hypothetical protein [Hymenobacter sp. DG01]
MGSAFSEQPNVKEEFDITGTLIRRASFESGRPTTIYSYNAKEQRTGAARLYAKDGVSYASGNYREDKPVGVWQNASLENDRYLTYKKGYKVEFEGGQAITIIDSNGSVRSLKAEARQREMEAANEQAAREAAAAAAPKVYARIAGVKSIRFTPDSYMLTPEGNAAIASIAKQINERASSAQKVSTVYISSHADGYSYTTTDTTKKMMYILTLNRSLAVKLALQEQLEDKSTSFVLYGCAGSLPTQNGDLSGFDDDVRVQMGFDEELPNAERVYSELKEKFGLGSGNVIVPNTIMRRSILKLVPSYFENEQLRQLMVDCAQGKVSKEECFYKIPQELWVPTVYTEKYGEAATEDFRKEVETMFYKLSKKYSLLSLNQGKGLLPSVLFHKELEQYMSKATN